MDGKTITDDPLWSVLLKNVKVKSYHPITVMNPDEWFIPKFIRLDYSYSGKTKDSEEGMRVKIWVRGDNTMWFVLNDCEVRRD